MTCSLINIFTVILYFTAIFEYHGHMRLRSSPSHQPTDHQLKCLYIYSTVSKSISMGPGGRQRKLSWSLNSSHYVFKNVYLTVHICNLLWNELNKYFCLCLCLLTRLSSRVSPQSNGLGTNQLKY